MLRRHLLKASALSGLGWFTLGRGVWAAAGDAQASAPPPRRLVVIMLRGAVDGLSVVVPHADLHQQDASTGDQRIAERIACRTQCSPAFLLPGLMAPQLGLQWTALNPFYGIVGVGLTSLGTAQAAAQFPMKPHRCAPSRRSAAPAAVQSPTATAPS